MQTIPGYLYPNRIWCQLVTDPLMDTRNIRVYAPNIKLYKNINNTVQVVFYNKDRRRINVNQYRFVLSIFRTNSPTTNLIKVADDRTTWREVDDDLIDITVPVLVYELTILDDGVAPHTKGLAELVVPAVDLEPLIADSYTYSIKAFDEFAAQHPAYVDDNTGSAGVVEIIDGVYSATEPLNYVDLGTL